MHRRTGEQVSGTTRLCDPVRERANKVFGKRYARLLNVDITARLPGRSAGPAARRLQRRLLRPVFTTASPTATSSTHDQYVRRNSICSGIMDTIVFALLLFMLVNASSMFEFHMLVAAVVMFNILELIMELLPNFSIIQKPYFRQ